MECLRERQTTLDRARSVKVVYISGYSRSGSTILGRLLAQDKRIVDVGELENLWVVIHRKTGLCGCGTDLKECRFWMEVLRAAFGESPNENTTNHVIELQRRLSRPGAIAQLYVRRARSRRFVADLREYASILHALYFGIATAAETDIIVDSSKWPYWPLLLTETCGVEAHVVHLVRDARGVAHSWGRTRIDEGHPEGPHALARLSPLRSTVGWAAVNLLAGVGQKQFASYTRIQYEKVMAAPGAGLSYLAQHVGEGSVASQLRRTTRRVWLMPSHSVSGNPCRYVVGETLIEPDEEWREKMGPVQRRVMSAVAGPLLRYYGYPLAVRPRLAVAGGEMEAVAGSVPPDGRTTSLDPSTASTTKRACR